MQTFVYDRAGMGKSTINTAMPYSIENVAHILSAALASCGVNGPIVMVGHSYAGAISLLAPSQDKRIKGVVLIEPRQHFADDSSGVNVQVSIDDGAPTEYLASMI